MSYLSVFAQLPEPQICIMCQACRKFETQSPQSSLQMRNREIFLYISGNLSVSCKDDMYGKMHLEVNEFTTTEVQFTIVIRP